MALCYIVEDHDDTREGFAEYLRWQGFDVRTAGSAVEFRALLAEHLPGAIVMDLVLPGTDGFTLTREIKADPRTKSVPVLVVSASVRPQDRESAELAGSDAFLPKPCDPEIIVSELHRLLRHAPQVG
jgi:CheY-like chemotaxis protein